jgi:Uma2 family endonuclease
MSLAEIEPIPSRFVLRGVPWNAYVLLRDAPENYHVRMTYDRGNLEMMSPSRWHERFSKLIGRLIEAWADEFDIPIQGCGTMTLRREDLERGLEPDNCYYIQHEAVMRAKEDLDLTTDPPPDLAIEVDLGRPTIEKPALYAALGVPELWRYDRRGLHVLQLDRDGRYADAESSEALPRFPVEIAERTVSELGTASDTALVKSFRERVRNEGLPGSPRAQ